MGFFDENFGSFLKFGGDLLGGFLDDSDETAAEARVDAAEISAEVKPRTVSGGDLSTGDIFYSAEDVMALRALVNQLDSWSKMDRGFWENTYLPFNEAVAQANLSIAGAVEAAAPATLEENMRDLVSNNALKAAFRESAVSGFGPDGPVDLAASNFFTELDALPTESELVGQALTQVEGQFGRAGKQLARDFASRGQAVSQASKRDLLIEKAKAKSGAAAAAGVQARTERQAAFEKGVGVALTQQEAADAAKANAIANLTALQTTQQFGLTTPTMAGLDPNISGQDSSKLTAGLIGEEAGKIQRTTTVGQDASFTQEGIKEPIFPGIETTTEAGIPITDAAQPISPLPQMSTLFPVEPPPPPTEPGGVIGPGEPVTAPRDGGLTGDEGSPPAEDKTAVATPVAAAVPAPTPAPAPRPRKIATQLPPDK